MRAAGVPEWFDEKKEMKQQGNHVKNRGLSVCAMRYHFHRIEETFTERRTGTQNISLTN